MPERNTDIKEKLPQRYPFIAVVGPVGIGKSTFTELVVNSVGVTQFQEPYKDNPYLKDFYTKNPTDFSFNCQMFFLANKGLQTVRIRDLSGKVPVIQDPGVEVDFIIATTQWKMGWMTDEEHGAYVSAFEKIYNDALNPDVYIALKAKRGSVIERIINRGREMELIFMKRFPEYFSAIVKEFDVWLEAKQKENGHKIVVIDTDKFDFANDEKKKTNAVKEVIDWSGYFITAPTQRNMVGSDGAKLIMPDSFRIRPHLVDRVPGAKTIY